MRVARILTTIAFAALAVPATATAAGSVSASVGTLGVGIQGAMPLGANANLRLGAKLLSVSRRYTETSVDYDGNLKLRTVGLLLDYHPFGGGFRFTGGAYWNGTKATLHAQPTGGTYTINGNTYAASDIANAEGRLDFRRIAPYLGVGWGRHAGGQGGLYVAADLGVMFVDPRIAYDFTCGSAVPAATCNQIRADVDAEKARIDSDLGKFNAYPVATFSLGYRF